MQERKGKRIAIIGCGNMGSAFARGLSLEHTLFLFDRNSEKMQALASNNYGRACSSLAQALKSADIVLLAIKPQNLEAAAKDIDVHLNKAKMVISLLAGVTLKALKSYFPSAKGLLRLMPNIAITCGQGVIAIACEEEPCAQTDTLTSLFTPLGQVFWLKESKMDAVSSLAGSGPAFIFTLFDAIIDASIAMGLSVQEAKPLALHMLKGSIALLTKSNQSSSELKWQVTSPAGTTIAGLRQLEKNSVRSGIIETFLATYERNRQLI